VELNGVEVEDTFMEMFPMWAGRMLVTAETEGWALTAASSATGFATSIIMSPAEAGIERLATADETPDGRPGVFLQVYCRDRRALKSQMVARIGQCIMTCPTTSAFNALEEAKRMLRVGRSLAYFGDGYQRRSDFSGRRVWLIPTMEGEFMVESRFGAKRGVAGGMFLILARDRAAGLAAAEKAAEASKKEGRVILPFPGGVCRSGSKVGSAKYKLGASTNQPYCPTLRGRITDSALPSEVGCVYEIIINGLTMDEVKRAVLEGMKAATTVPGIVRLTAANYGGRLGRYRLGFRELVEA